MFSFLKKQNARLLAPIDGKVISLDDVDDPIFSNRMMGDGVAIQASGDIAYAPADGIISVTIETKHAFGMILDNEMELIIHVGINKKTAKQDGFEILVDEHEYVKAGTPIIKIDRSLFTDEELITPVIITNPECFKIINNHIGEEVIGKESELIAYR